MLGLWKTPADRLECNSHDVNNDELNRFDVVKLLDFRIENTPANATICSQHTCHYPEHIAVDCLKSKCRFVKCTSMSGSFDFTRLTLGSVF